VTTTKKQPISDPVPLTLTADTALDGEQCGNPLHGLKRGGDATAWCTSWNLQRT